KITTNGVRATIPTRAAPERRLALQSSVTVRHHCAGGLAGCLAALTVFLLGLLLPTELAAQQDAATPNDYWFKIATAVIAIPAALVATLAIRKTRLETQKLQLELDERTAETEATANEASDRANTAAAQAEKANKEAQEAREKLDRFIFLA